MTHVMREKGIDPNTDPGSRRADREGVVSQMRRTGGAQLVEVTIGADDGLEDRQHAGSLPRRQVLGPHRNHAKRRPISRSAASIAGSNKARFRRAIVSLPESSSDRAARRAGSPAADVDLHGAAGHRAAGARRSAA